MSSPEASHSIPHADARRKDLKRELQRQATEATARYVREHMRGLQSVESVPALHDLALAARSLPGLVMEFGVYSGQTINYIAERVSGSVHGFDSFEGLPETWRDGFAKGHFALPGLPTVRENVRLHKGLFDHTLPVFLREQAPHEPVSFMHVDCDLYSSTRSVLGLLATRLVRGTVIVFDEYFNYDGWEEHEFRAFREFVRERGARYEYLSYNALHEQVAVRIL